MFHIVLYQPEIPPNTGNIIRLCANTGCHLHLIKPLGFQLEEKSCRRAGLDYHEWAAVKLYDDFDDFLRQHQGKNIYACSSKGAVRYTDCDYQAEDMFLFGPETRGLPESVKTHEAITRCIKIPMKTSTRSLNLSNSAAVILFEAWRQCEFG